MAIETPSPGDTARLLPSFTPFRVVHGSGSPTPPDQSPLLLLFKGNEKLEKPDGEPSEEVCLDGVMFSIYHREGSTWVAIERDGVEYVMFVSADKRSYKCNLSLTDPGERFSHRLSSYRILAGIGPLPDPEITRLGNRERGRSSGILGQERHGQEHAQQAVAQACAGVLPPKRR